MSALSESEISNIIEMRRTARNHKERRERKEKRVLAERRAIS